MQVLLKLEMIQLWYSFQLASYQPHNIFVIILFIYLFSHLANENQR